MLISGEYGACGGETGYGNSIFSAQSFCEPKITLKNKIHFKGKKSVLELDSGDVCTTL